MGGQRETVISSPAPQAKGVETVTASNIRIHENAGYVHLHDDAANLRVAVPSDVFMKRFAAWQDSIVDELIFIDEDAETMAKFIASKRNEEMKILIVVSKIKFDDGYKQLLKFVAGK